jgi:hypothetical protein
MKNRLFHFLGIVFIGAALLALTLSGCSGSGSGDSVTEDGTLVIGLTDAEGDFLRYEVDVVSLTLTKRNGAVVNALPVETRVDFSQYTEMIEFLTAATVPTGRYVKATLTLDYRNADIQIEDAGGDTIDVETILDEDGLPITTLPVEVHLEGRNSLVIAPGIPVHLTLDFNLEASNHVDLSIPDAPVLTVEPYLLAEVNLENNKIHRLRGPLKEVNPADGTFRVIIRPFIHLLAGGDERFGTLEVVTDGETIYDINGQYYEGDEGLEVLDQQQVLTAVVVIGDLDINLRQFEARHVYAGSSVPGGDLDVVTGNVVSRTGNQLAVRGATLIRAQGSVVFNDEMEILLENTTIVGRQLSKDRFDIDAISVGQRIMVFGELDEDESVLDATQGYVIMLLTTLKGTVVNVDSNVVVSLTAIDGRSVDVFDFLGTGIDPDNDADPANYDVDPADLDTSGLEIGTPVKFRGFVTPLGHPADQADFEARTMINVSQVKGLMIANWFPAATDAIESISEMGITLNVENAGHFHHLIRAGVALDLTGLDDAPIIESEGDGSGLFQIVQDGSRQFFFTFEGFVEALSDRLDNDAAVTHILATGTFDDANAILASDFIIVGLN